MPDHLSGEVGHRVDPIARANAEGMAYGGPVCLDPWGFIFYPAYYGQKEMVPIVYDAHVMPSFRVQPDDLLRLVCDLDAEARARIGPRVEAYCRDHGRPTVIEEVSTFVDDPALEQRVRENGIAGVSFDELRARAEAVGLVPMTSLAAGGRRTDLRMAAGQAGRETTLPPGRIAEILRHQPVGP